MAAKILKKSIILFLTDSFYWPNKYIIGNNNIGD